MNLFLFPLRPNNTIMVFMDFFKLPESEYKKIYYKHYREEIRAYKKIWRKYNPDYFKIWRKYNPDYFKLRCLRNKIFKTMERIR